MDKLIKEIEEKIQSCNDNTKEGRARKGAYVDCLVLIEQMIEDGEFKS